MEKKLIILSQWKGESEFQQLKSDVENHIDGIDIFFYLFSVKNTKLIDELPQIPNIYYITRKDFSLMGKLKSPNLIEVLNNNKKEIIIVATETNYPLLKKVLKNSKLMSIGIEMETLPKFDVSFKDAELKDGMLFKQVNNYLTKIQL